MSISMRKYFFPVLAVCLLAAGSFGCAGPLPGPKKPDPDLTILTIGTADSGGTMYPVGKAIAETVNNSDNHIFMNISAGTGSFNNIHALAGGDVDLGLVSGDVAHDARSGSGEFSEPVELRALAAVYPSLSNWIALSSDDLVWVHDLDGKQIGIGPEDSTTAVSALFALKAAGVDKNSSGLVYCGLGSGAENVKNGTFDAVHGFAGIPVNSFFELSEEVPCRILKYTEAELKEIIRENPAYYRDAIPAGTYHGQTTVVPTFGIKILLCVRADMDEELAYELTKILYENLDALIEQHAAMSAMKHGGFMYEELPIELHPGAERFYRENGLPGD